MIDTDWLLFNFKFNRQRQGRNRGKIPWLLGNRRGSFEVEAREKGKLQSGASNIEQKAQGFLKGMPERQILKAGRKATKTQVYWPACLGGEVAKAWTSNSKVVGSNPITSTAMLCNKENGGDCP